MIETIDYHKMRVFGAWILEPIRLSPKGVIYRREGNYLEEIMTRDEWNNLPIYEVKS